MLRQSSAAVGTCSRLRIKDSVQDGDVVQEKDLDRRNIFEDFINM